MKKNKDKETENSLTELPETELSQKKQSLEKTLPLLLLFGDAVFANSVKDLQYEGFDKQVFECEAISFVKTAHEKITELTKTYSGEMYIGNYNVVPVVEELQLLQKSLADFADFSTLTSRESSHYTKYKEYIICPYPAITGAVLAVKNAETLHKVKLYNAYTQDLFLQMTMQISAKKAYIYYKTTKTVVTDNQKSGCKTC